MMNNNNWLIIAAYDIINNNDHISDMILMHARNNTNNSPG